MWDFKPPVVFFLMKKTYPFLAFRFLIYAAITGISIAITGGGAGLGWIGGTLVGEVGGGVFYGGALGAMGTAGFLYIVREYLLYQVKTGHIALLVKLLHGEEVPEGKDMVVFGQEQVKKHFKESSVLFLVDQTIKGVLKVIVRTLNTAGNFLPIPGLSALLTVIGKIIAMSLTYVDELILAYHMKNGSNNVWTNSCKALVLFVQNYGVMLKNAFWVSLLVWGLTLIVFVVVLGPLAALTTAIPSLQGFWTLVVAALLSYGIKSAIIDPIAMTALMQVYFTAIQSQSPSPEWEQKLDGMSDKFREMKAKGQAAPNPLGR